MSTLVLLIHQIAGNSALLYWTVSDHVCPHCMFCAGVDAGRSVPEQADQHVREEHGEGLYVGHHEAMWETPYPYSWFVWVGCRFDGFSNSDVTSCSMCAASMKCQARLKKMASKGEPIEYRCLVCATDGKRNISTSVLFTFSLLLVRHYVCWMCFALILCLMVIRLPLFSPLVCYDLNYRSNISVFPSCICCMNWNNSSLHTC